MNGRHTPLNGPKDRLLELFGKSRMHGPCFLLFALKCLEIVHATLARELALELFEMVERHSRGIGPVRTGMNM